jgi:GNAT superfamily N-acetyltransferase
MTNKEFLENFYFSELTGDLLAKCEPFVCGHDDLDDFFNNDAIKYTEKMIGRTYVFRPVENKHIIACAFSVANDSLRITDLSNRKQEKFREYNNLDEKRLKRYPGILIGRLAVNVKLAHKGIGTALMNFLKIWLNGGNKAGCRFLIVDARNAPEVLSYYQKNDFDFLFVTEEEESIRTRKDKAVVKQTTRLMYFDLKRLIGTQ